MAGESASGDILLLYGDLGVGKTVFAKGFAAGLGIDEPVTSPTFTLVHEYEGTKKLYHFDLYRIGDPDELYDIGYEEYFYSDGISLVEWPERLEDLKPDTAIEIHIEKELSEVLDYRKITIEKI
ncbi:MAG: tRNA (adenosine(37)-N6)-threonylcarbamoyltransferase complex ATPase subunit type 1 TsaE [Eubacterium sp.]|nr:tRNA (adenosine(37)-N6)-threonylcarbamoyltransferase complex ATPase subunit type 1 TsaE [Eubacterium sp.]